ncbi:MAG: 3-hydroxy-acyl-[acyl-carrier-protein] dehydratase [Candidatus Westeberhardia cardiocondylae]|nr:3-hydroxy-acyl-[acyl-carrier-protein] dehydratase [Candidatus Westeberhardia cardiocondylae]
MNNKSVNNISVKDILTFLPHRFPFLLIDRIIKFKKEKFLHAIKNVSFNEQCFQGHFPNKPIFPGVLILESMIQATGILYFKSLTKLSPKEHYYVAAINSAKFKYLVQPGDQINIEATLIKKRKKILKFKVISKVKNQIICEALIICAIKKEKITN